MRWELLTIWSMCHETMAIGRVRLDLDESTTTEGPSWDVAVGLGCRRRPSFAGRPVRPQHIPPPRPESRACMHACTSRLKLSFNPEACGPGENKSPVKKLQIETALIEEDDRIDRHGDGGRDQLEKPIDHAYLFGGRY